MKIRLFILMFLLIFKALFAQSALLSSDNKSKDSPKGYRKILLGMGLDEVKAALLEDKNFDYRGDPDVAFLPLQDQNLIECEGKGFIQRAYFQFLDEKLYIIIIQLNQEKLDYFTLFSNFSDKYGLPDTLDPKNSRWDWPEVRFALEKPLTVKYVALKVFNELKQESKAEDDLLELSRKKFLEDF